MLPEPTFSQLPEHSDIVDAQPAFHTFSDCKVGTEECLARLYGAEKTIRDVRLLLGQVFSQSGKDVMASCKEGIAPCNNSNADEQHLSQKVHAVSDQSDSQVPLELATIQNDLEKSKASPQNAGRTSRISAIPAEHPERTKSNFSLSNVIDHETIDRIAHAHIANHGFPCASPGSMTWHAQNLVQLRLFEMFIGFVIVANAVTIGIENDNAMQQPQVSQNVAIGVVDKVFSFIYIAELMLRIVAWHCKGFFTSVEWRWNVFDTVLVVAAVYEITLSLLDMENLDMTFTRLFRIMKMAKMFRVVRLAKLFRELRLIIYSIQGSAPTMFWSLMLIFNTTFIFGVAILQSCAQHLESAVDEQEEKKLRSFWGSLPQAMLTLYWAGTGGESWRILAEPLIKVGAFTHAIFLLYVAFFTLVIVNTATSLFLEATLLNAEKDPRQLVLDEIEKKREVMQHLHVLFNVIDEDNSGEITLEEFCSQLGSPEMQAFCAKVELDIHDVAIFFSILGSGDQKAVRMEDFVDRCMKLKGFAKSFDLINLTTMVAECTEQLKELKIAMNVNTKLDSNVAIYSMCTDQLKR